MPTAFISDAQVHLNNITLQPEGIEILNQFKNGMINVTELCSKLGEYGLQVVKVMDDKVKLCMDMTNGSSEVTISFVVEL